MALNSDKVKVERLSLRVHDASGDPDDPLRSDLSAAASSGVDIWTANDEYARVERLSLLDDGAYGEHRRFEIADCLDLPEGRGEEMDIEGLDVADGCLWVLGSHSRTRKKPEPEHDPNEVLKRLSKLKDSPDRLVLWPGAFADGSQQVVPALSLKVVAELPSKDSLDHPEGLALLEGGDDKTKLLVAHDSPAPDRTKKDGVFEADLVSLPKGWREG